MRKVSEGEQKPKPLNVHLSGFNLAFLVVVLIIWWVGLQPILAWSGVDPNCNGGGGSRRWSMMEAAVCSIAEGPKGWVYLAWMYAPAVGIIWWLGAKLKKARRERQ